MDVQVATADFMVSCSCNGKMRGHAPLARATKIAAHFKEAHKNCFRRDHEEDADY